MKISYLFLAATLSTLQAAPEEEKRVMVVAMMKAASHGPDESWHMWRYPGHKPTQKDANGRHDLASVMYPLIGPYDVSDPHYQDYVIHNLRMVGVDTISLWWPGTNTKLEYTDPDGSTLSLKEVRSRFAKKLVGTGIQACLRGGYDDEADLSSATTLLGEATWKQKDRPVIMWFTAPKETEFSSARITAWKAAQPTAPWFLHVLLDATDDRYQPAAWTDATYSWIGRIRAKGAVYETGDFGTPPAHYGFLVRSDAAVTTNIALENAALQTRSLTHHLSAISPGFDDRAVGAWGQKTRDGQRSLTGIERSPGQMHSGTHTYEQRWESVLKQSGVTTVVIPTWDDWNEGSQIEPSVEDGVSCLEVTRRSIARFKSLAEPVSGNTSLLLPTHLYRLRKAAKNDPFITQQLDALSQRLSLAQKPADFQSIDDEVTRFINRRFPEVTIEETRFWPPTF
jgi:hypothetical protein